MALTNIESARKAIEIERAQYEALITCDDGTPSVWEDLVMRSAPHIERRPYFPRWSPYSAFTPSSSPGYYGIPSALADEWERYVVLWEAFMDANPRVRIAELMSDISEAYDSSSFPYGYERNIEAWVRSRFEAEPPVPYMGGVDTPEWRQRFLDAADAATGGWVSYDDGTGRYLWRK